MIIQVRRVRDFGAGGSIECVMQSEPGMKKEDALVIFDQLAEMADKALAHYMSVNNHKIEANPMIGEGGLVDVRVFPADEICVTMKDGKKLHKVKGGEYTEFGVPFYAEYMKLNGVNPAEIPDEGVKLNGMQMLVEFKNNAPKRVVKLEKVESG